MTREERRSRSVPRRITELISTETDQPVSIRQNACEAVRVVARADAACCCGLAMLAGEPHVSFTIGVGDPEIVERFKLFAASHSIEIFRGAALSHPRRAGTPGFVSTARDAAEEAGRASPTASASPRVAMPGCLAHLLAYRNSLFVGWIGAFSSACERRLSASDRRRLRPLAVPVVQELARAAVLDGADLEESCTIVLAADGVIDMQSEGATRWLAIHEFARRLRAAAVRLAAGSGSEESLVIAGGEVSLRMVDSERGRRVVASVRRANGIFRPPDATLSPALRRVAEFAAAGATLAEIARANRVTTETVKSQLRDVYRLLDVASRVELARALAQAANG